MKELKLLTDEILIKEFLSGNELCLEVLITRHKAKIYSHILKKARKRELAEDIFQDAFIKAVTSLKDGKYTEDGKFAAWIIRIAQNLIIDYFRKNKNRKEITPNFDIYSFIAPNQELECNIEDQIITKQTYSEVEKLIDMLPPIQKEVLRLRIYCNLSFKEIAEETNVSVNTALGRMRYALINMKKLIDTNKIYICTPSIQ